MRKPISWVLAAGLLVLLGIGVALSPATGADERVHRNGFGGKETYWVRGDANIHFDETSHKISDEHARNALTSEYIKIEAKPKPGAKDVEFAHYYYDTPPAPVTNDLVARIYVKAYREGAQLKARVVLPKEKDPRNPEVPLTTLIPGEIYSRTRTWQQLTIPNPADALRKHHAVLHAKLGRAVDLTGAYIDQLVLNVYEGPGVSEVWIDDLEIGPVIPKAEGAPGGRQAKPVSREKGRIPTVEFSNGDILVDNEAYFMIGIRHSDTPLEVLRNALINTIWFPEQVDEKVYEEAVAAKFFLVPSLPLPSDDWDPSRPTKNTPAAYDKDAKIVAEHLRKFIASDAVLMWNLGSNRTTDQVRRVARLADVVRTYDPRRPRAVDLWDGYRAYSSYVEAIGAHRWPLFTSLEMGSYRDWLAQRKALTAPSKLSWTWIQTHLPEWYVQLNTGKPECEKFDTPIGPHPEQIRTLTYMSIAAGYRGIGYWSDRFLAESHHGKSRLLEIAMLNAEIEMLKPVLMNAQQPAKWYATSDPNVRAAVIQGPKEIVVLPIWFGTGTQYCPQTATLPSLKIKIPLVPNGAVPWVITPVGIDEIKTVRRIAEGTEITLTEFDTTAAIVFTGDLSLTGKVVRWQDFTRNKLASTASGWARQQAVEQFNTTLATYKAILAAGGPPILDATELFEQSKKSIQLASEFTDNAQPDVAYKHARRALRPLRALMRDCWTKATESLDTPTASPYAVSVYSLPKHWELARYIQGARPAGNSLPHSGFELNAKVDEKNGAAIASLPGWKSRTLFLDSDVEGAAAIVNSLGLEDKPPEVELILPTRTAVPGRPQLTKQELFALQPKPMLGNHSLRLLLQPKKALVPELKKAEEKKKELLDQDLEIASRVPPPLALERSFVAVDSPPVAFAPGTWVRISFWLKTLGISSSADGVLIYDSVGGEPLSVRSILSKEWKHFHLYREVPASGRISLSFALTGIGSAFVDDVAIEAMTGATSPAPSFSTPTWRYPPKPQPTSEDRRTLPYPRPTPDVLPPPRAVER